MSGHQNFEKMGKDVFIAAAPNTLTVFVADAEAITQITTRRNDFPKPLDMYGSLNIYGMNLVSTEGPEWRSHRKLVAPSFGEKNNELVFNETLHHAKSMLSLWAGSDGRGNQTVSDPSAAAMNFALYIISSAGFDVRVAWPHEEGREEASKGNADRSISVGSKAPPGHAMSYREALSELLHNIVWTQVIPIKWLCKIYQHHA
jgi:cytochrome P450